MAGARAVPNILCVQRRVGERPRAYSRCLAGGNVRPSLSRRCLGRISSGISSRHLKVTSTIVVGPPTGGPRVLLSRAGGMAIFGRSSPRVAPSSQSFSASRCISIFMPTQLSWLAIFRIYGSVRRARKKRSCDGTGGHGWRLDMRSRGGVRVCACLRRYCPDASCRPSSAASQAVSCRASTGHS